MNLNFNENFNVNFDIFRAKLWCINWINEKLDIPKKVLFH